MIAREEVNLASNDHDVEELISLISYWKDQLEERGATEIKVEILEVPEPYDEFNTYTRLIFEGVVHED